jgi:tRNA threonylcarbamoyl adenosine modification protein YeaZ
MIHRASAGEGDHFEQLPRLVAQGCAEAGIAQREIRAVVVGVGPGSFTGIRIGMSFAKGFAWSIGAPLFGRCSFHGCAAAYRQTNTSAARIVVIADARREELFFAAFSCTDAGVWLIEQAPMLIANNALAHYVTESTHVVSSQREWGEGLLKEIGAKHVVHRVEGSAVGLLTVFSLAGVSSGTADGRTLEKIIALEPTYIREVAAKTIEQRRVEKGQ